MERDVTDPKLAIKYLVVLQKLRNGPELTPPKNNHQSSAGIRRSIASRNAFKFVGRHKIPIGHLVEQRDLKELARRLNRVFPGLVVMSEGTNTVTVMGTVKVTPDGITQGSGPVADKVRAILEEYIRDKSEELSSIGPKASSKGTMRNPFRCQHCGLRLVSGPVYRRTIGGTVMLFCCKQCADHEEAEIARFGAAKSIRT